jgi:hypothetical protein
MGSLFISIKMHWHIIKLDFSRMIRYVHKKKRMGGATNSSFLALISKQLGVTSLDRFRHISLCNISYKIMAKIVSNRLTHFLRSLILPNQGGFVAGRQIWDNFILVQEEIHSSNSQEESSMAIKLDMENSFYRVEHEFLFKVMQKFGFNQEFISWMRSYICNPWITPLLNGRPPPLFRASIGIRQGFPLSPLLYVIMVESLNCILEWECANGIIPRIKIAQGVKQINHSQLVDDMILLSGDSKIMARRIKQVLDTCLSASGGLLNKAKSQIYVWNFWALSRLGISQILGFSISNEWKTFKYLGLPMCLKLLPR